MTDRDPDLQAALVDARRELARRFQAGAVADPDTQAADFMDWLAGRGLRLIPPPPVVRTGTTGSRTPWRDVIGEKPCHRTAAHHRHTWNDDGQGVVCPGLPMPTRPEETP